MEILMILAVRYGQAIILASLGLCGFLLGSYTVQKRIFMDDRLEPYEFIMTSLFRLGPIGSSLLFTMDMNG